MNANQRLDPTPPGYNPLPSSAVLKNSHQSLAFEMYQNHHIKQSRCTCAGTHTHTNTHAYTYACSYIQTDTYSSACWSKNTHHSICPRVTSSFFFFKRVTLAPKPLSKHTFMDTTIILTCPRIYSPCWRGTEDQLCRFVECWWAFTPQRVVSCISNNPELENASLFWKDSASVLLQSSFPSAPNDSRWSHTIVWHGAKTCLLFSGYPGKWSILGPKECTSKYENPKLFAFTFVFKIIKHFQYLHCFVRVPQQHATNSGCTQITHSLANLVKTSPKEWQCLNANVKLMAH